MDHSHLPLTSNSHPCASHINTCDHCYSCEVLGICCTSTPASVFVASAITDLGALRQAIAEDAADRTSFADLVQIDGLTRSLIELLAVAEERTSDVDTDSSQLAAAPALPAAPFDAPHPTPTAMPALPAAKESLLDLLINQRKAGK
jgi:hypothetical protein